MSLTASTRQRGRAAAGRAALLPGPDSGWWLAATAAGFTLAQLLFVSTRMGLSWDESVYVSQLSGHAPAAFFDAARARGVPLLVAPVTILTSSVTALRVYLAVMSGLGLLGALWVWRAVRPAWVLALAGTAFATLWAALYYGPQAMPDLWVALCSLAAVGFLLRAVRDRQDHGAFSAVFAERTPRSWRAAPAGQAALVTTAAPTARTGQAQPAAGAGRPATAAALAMAVCLALAALFRPGDAAFLTATLVLAILAVRSWRRWPLLAVALLGSAAGAAEWVIEAYARFGSLARRLRIAGAEQGGLGLHLGVWDQLRAVNGPTLCRPCTIGWRYPELSLWWLALPALVILGLAAARRAGWLRSSGLAAAAGLGLAAQYLLMVGYAAPRFLLPAYALLSIPVADFLRSILATGSPERRRIALAAVAVALTGQFMVQLVVLNHEVAGSVKFHNDYQRIVTDLARLDVRPPCLIKGDQYIPIGYLAGCGSAGTPATALAAGHPVAVLELARRQPPAYAATWRRVKLPGTRILRLYAYLSPR